MKEKPIPKPVVLSSLAMRFYVSCGWTKSLLRSYLLKGSLKYFDDADPYYILTPHSTIDVDLMVNDGHVGELLGKDRWRELRGMTDLEILRNRNW